MSNTNHTAPGLVAIFTPADAEALAAAAARHPAVLSKQLPESNVIDLRTRKAL